MAPVEIGFGLGEAFGRSLQLGEIPEGPRQLGPKLGKLRMGSHQGSQHLDTLIVGSNGIWLGVNLAAI